MEHGKTSTKLGYYRAFKILPHFPLKLKELQVNRKLYFEHTHVLISTSAYMLRIEFRKSYFGTKIGLSDVQQEISHVKLTLFDYNFIICFECCYVARMFYYYVLQFRMYAKFNFRVRLLQ